MKKRSFFSVFGGILVSAVIIFLLYYTMLPAINLKSQDFIIFLILSTLIILTVNFITYMKEFLSGLGSRTNVRVRQNPLTGQIQFETEEREPDEVTPRRSLARPLKIGFGFIGILIVLMVIATAIGIPFFNATRYRDLIQMETGEISKKLKKGKHTTRHSQMIPIDHETYLCDTPGFSSLYTTDMEKEELKNFFPEFHPYEGKCRFLGCIHGKEPGCAVKEALEQGNISKERFENYTMFYEELKEQEKRRY